jgi:alkylation response protein AidB-like acyl-CoA dehydrogenase
MCRGKQSVLACNPLGRLEFNQVEVDSSCIVANPQTSNLSKGAWFYSIANRLLSGRILLSCSQIHNTKILLQTMQRKWAHTSIGFIQETLTSCTAKLDKLEGITWSVADSYNFYTSKGEPIPRQLQDDIAFVKAFVPRECMTISEQLRRVAGGIGFLEVRSLANRHHGASCFRFSVAEACVCGS